MAHNELLLKLWSFGITDSLWLWLCAYLTNRLQCVSINGSVSDVLPVISGVPEGSILGPLLFLIFVYDLSELVSSSMVLLFADDANCVKSITTFPDCISLQRDLNKLAEWSLIWNLPFNEEKCTLLRFALKEAPVLYNYYVKNNPVLVKTAHRDLGIIMSNGLQWKQHYQLNHIQCLVCCVGLSSIQAALGLNVFSTSHLFVLKFSTALNCGVLIL